MKIMKSRWIVGGGEFLDQAYRAWKQARPDEAIEKIEVPQSRDHTFDVSLFDSLDPAMGAMFIAFDERFGNFKRMELMQAAVERGFKLDAFVSPAAIVATDAVIGPNVFIGDGVCIGSGARIDYNTVVHPGAKLGYRVRVRASCWIEMGVVLGEGVEVGAHSILRMGAIAGPRIKVGRNCELGWPQLYSKDIPSRTVFDTRYDEPISVFGA
jgi:acetyltransferase-like isoleucine patch superfamily enzyme